MIYSYSFIFWKSSPWKIGSFYRTETSSALLTMPVYSEPTLFYNFEEVIEEPFYNWPSHGDDERMKEQDHCSLKPAGHCQMGQTFQSFISPSSPSGHTETLISWGHGRRPSVTGSLAVRTKNVTQATKEIALNSFPVWVNTGVWETRGVAACETYRIGSNASLWLWIH